MIGFALRFLLRLINQVVNGFFGLLGLQLIPLERLIYAARIHPYRRVLNVIRYVFGERPVTIVEVGAWRGQIIDLFLGEKNIRKVHAIEPNVELVNLLKSKYSNDQRVSVYPFGLSDKVEKTQLFITESDNLSSLILPKDTRDAELKVRKTVDVEISTGDQFMGDHHVDFIDVLSLNVQGFETQVLRGFERALYAKKIKSVIVEVDLSDRYKRTSFFDIENILQKYGFVLFEINSIKARLNYLGKNQLGVRMLDCFYVLEEELAKAAEASST